jgi:hypothetical protein
MTEYIYVAKGSRPEVDDSGQVIRILEVSSKLKGGEAKLIELMEKAGWKIASPPGPT